ncbi:MAG: (2Fe-2S)-binding protein [Burkholderiales bacterium]|nr:(2Fe-2S)-binding protein [Burkholderiales bacterium]
MSVFRRLAGAKARAEVVIDVDGERVVAREGDTLAAAMLVAGCVPFRASERSGAPRAPLCMIGACFECRVEVDGAGSRRACQVVVVPGMRVRRSRAARPGA